MIHKALLIYNFLISVWFMAVFSSETCKEDICENSLSMPLVNKMDAALKAEVDMSKLNKHLQAYIKQEIQKGVREEITKTLNNKVEETKAWMQTSLNQTFKDYDDKSKAQRPAFHASLIRNHQFSIHGEILKFEHIWTNTANGYNNSNGIFTAPRSGIYQVMATMYSLGTTPCHTYLYKNDVLLNWGYAGGHNADSGTVHAVLHLQEGDKIYIKSRGGNHINDIAHGHYHSEFSGFLIH